MGANFSSYIIVGINRIAYIYLEFLIKNELFFNQSVFYFCNCNELEI